MKRFFVFLLIPVICLTLAAWTSEAEEILPEFTEPQASGTFAADTGARGLRTNDDGDMFTQEDYEVMAELLSQALESAE